MTSERRNRQVPDGLERHMAGRGSSKCEDLRWDGVGVLEESKGLWLEQMWEELRSEGEATSPRAL